MQAERKLTVSLPIWGVTRWAIAALFLHCPNEAPPAGSRPTDRRPAPVRVDEDQGEGVLPSSEWSKRIRRALAPLMIGSLVAKNVSNTPRMEMLRALVARSAAAAGASYRSGNSAPKCDAV